MAAAIAEEQRNVRAALQALEAERARLTAAAEAEKARLQKQVCGPCRTFAMLFETPFISTGLPGTFAGSWTRGACLVRVHLQYAFGVYCLSIGD